MAFVQQSIFHANLMESLFWAQNGLRGFMRPTLLNMTPTLLDLRIKLGLFFRHYCIAPTDATRQHFLPPTSTSLTAEPGARADIVTSADGIVRSTWQRSAASVISARRSPWKWQS